MIEFNEKYMDEEEFEKFYPIAFLFIKENLPSIEFDLKFKQSPCLGEGNPIVDIVIENCPFNIEGYIINYFYSKEFIEKTEKWQKEFGLFTFILKNKIVEDVIDVKIGDLVVVDNDYGLNDSNVGVVSSIVETKEGKLFGCSYFVVQSVFSKPFGDFVALTEEDYGGYKKGFAKKISKKEAENIIFPLIEKEYNKCIEVLEEKKNDAEKFMCNILKDLSVGIGFGIEKSERLRIDSVSPNIHPSIKNR